MDYSYINKRLGFLFDQLKYKQTNCLTEIFIDKALERAAECDKYLKENGKPIGALHGLPISLKDQIRLKGLETTMGKYRTIHMILPEKY